MSAYYSVSACFGFAVEGETPEVVDDLDPYDGAVDKWLATNGCPDLRFDAGGNQWAGPHRWTVYVEGTMRQIWSPGRGDATVVTRLDDSAIYLRINPVKSQLNTAAALLHYEGSSNWLVLVDVT